MIKKLKNKKKLGEVIELSPSAPKLDDSTDVTLFFKQKHEVLNHIFTETDYFFEKICNNLGCYLSKKYNKIIVVNNFVSFDDAKFENEKRHYKIYLRLYVNIIKNDKKTIIEQLKTTFDNPDISEKLSDFLLKIEEALTAEKGTCK